MTETPAKKDRLEALKTRQAQIGARIKEIERREGAAKRKADTRVKVLIGAALMADAAIHENTAETLRHILERSIVKPNDRAFLQAHGWMTGAQ